MMKERTLRVLEFTKIREWLASKALTPMGVERCMELVPTDNLPEIELWQAETEEAQADIPDFEEEDDDEQELCGKWSAFPFVLAPAMLYLLFGFLFGWWLKGCILFLTIPLYYSIANWVDGGRKGSILRAIPYPVVAVMVYLFIGLIANVWHPTWIIFLTIPVYEAAVGYILREK